MTTWLTAVLVFASVACSVSAQIQITGFGTGDFTVDSSTLAITSQTATAIALSTNDQSGTFAGYFGATLGERTVDITGQSSRLALTATVTTNPASNFNLTLFDSSLNTHAYQGNWASFLVGAATTAVLNEVAGQSGPFDFGAVVGFDLGFGGTGSPIVVTLDNLSTSAIPEPGALTFTLGCIAAAAHFVRRRVAARCQ